MMKIKNKISYFLILTAMVMGCNFACANEVVKSEEIVSETLQNMMEDDDSNNSPSVFTYGNQSFNKSESYKYAVDPNRPEFEIKNLSDYLKEKRANNAQTTENKKDDKEGMQIDCTEMEYFEERNELEARGDVEITTPSGVKVTADKAIYNKENNTIKLINNVEIKRGPTTVNGEYMLVDLNEENAIMDEPVTRTGNIRINAKEGYAYSDRIENLSGNVELNQRVEMKLYSSGFTSYGRAINDLNLVDFDLKSSRSKPYKIRTKEIVIRPERDHDSMLMKDVDIYYNKRKILNAPSIEIFTDKEMTYKEVNFPVEFGSLKGMGMYFGLGYTFKLPKTYTFRVTPLLSYGDNEIGAGGILMLKSNKLRLEGGWASSTNNLIVDGEYKLTDKLRFDFGRHVYKSEWFNGGTRAGYIGELAYDDSYLVKDLGNSVFRHRISAGYVADYKREHQEDDMRDGFRYRYMAELSKSLKTFGSKEQDMYVNISALAQTMATVYSETGDTMALFRVGPSITSRVKRWNSNITYTLGGVHGHSPYAFDEYRYGRQTIMFDESLILNKYISVGYRGTLSPLKDNYDKDILTENRFYAVVGPEDVKVAFSYDAVRQNMNFNFLFLLGSDNLDLRYEKLTVQNPDKLGKRQVKQSDKDLYKITVPESL